MPPVMRVNGSPFSSLYRNYAFQDRVTAGMAQVQGLQALEVVAPGAIPRGFNSRLLTAQLATLFSLSQINIQFWIDQIKQFFQSLKSTNELAKAAQ